MLENCPEASLSSSAAAGQRLVGVLSGGWHQGVARSGDKSLCPVVVGGFGFRGFDSRPNVGDCAFEAERATVTNRAHLLKNDKASITACL